MTPSGFRLVLTNIAQKDLGQVDSRDRGRIISELKNLEGNPYSENLDIKKLRSVKLGKWRMRVGEYRIRFDILEKDIVVHRIRHRRDIY